MKQSIAIFATIVVLLGAALLIGTVAQPMPELGYQPERATLAGTYLCLPRTGVGAATEECRAGIYTEAGEYYGIDFMLMSQTPPELVLGTRISAKGIVVPIERISSDWSAYPVKGIFSVTDGVVTHELPEGQQLGFVKAVRGSTIAFDTAEWLTAREAEDEAIHDGLCTEAERGDCLPNGYYINNDSEQSVDIVLGPNAGIFMQTWQMEETGEVAEREITLEQFAELITDSTQRWSKLPYQLTIDRGEVVRIDEVYVP